MKYCMLVLVVGLLAGCGSLTRTPISEADLADAAPYGIPGVRAWGDSLSEPEIEQIVRNQVALLRLARGDALSSGGEITQTVLALSGGGPDGAFGAGILAGWSKRGDRPEFDVVTGVSTGSIIGLFAFLGPEYDDDLREIYTAYKTDQLMRPAFLSALTGGAAFTDTQGYNDLIDQYVDEAVVARLAAEAKRGRLLLFGTTNLDASRPVIWNITAIAASGHPSAITLIRDLVRASSAIPAVFPPVVIPAVTASGEKYDELHVDGGATAQVMLFSPQLPITRVDAAIGAKVDRTLYVIVNNSLQKPYEPVNYNVFSIAGRAASSLIGGSGGGDLYKLFAIAERDNIDFNVTWIPDDVGLEPTEAFDTVYMEALYDIGLKLGENGVNWRQYPPNFVAN